MKKVAATTLVFMGLMACVIVFNIILCVAVPEYKDFLTTAVAEETAPPVVKASTVSVTKKNEKPTEEKLTLEELKEKYDISALACSSSCDEECGGGAERTIVDKAYHEDCGTGKGYWVITYSDGSTAVE
ncbi:hypothetical protein [Butyrivibrio sp. M55]|uniref:hypothetical protein n=1 Tax=Butyrivibrio sp. M55 TaxID=1855323 RepID=UPI0008F18ECD|nr:hypothetical protein [Butyrivibrio sp. M55]SFU47502.1 hypothetical protein SAMN05216540_102361 [Butyrivibrio sp. M55]